ncbi:MAG: Lrp/AsnC family transcriptional regulator [Nanoarchaeota archaeon]|nr:Lrp/AsnC family transcriptional regulator [Nanoarchaeota archaeon]MBU1322194.1 Lrp/AsnC family transcriptional regulator [Nanoarchaeota archaeon]MBU1597735.1 Lrp/AsnC family transcriptional regulator [Nanoarchaeota archaeon]
MIDEVKLDLKDKKILFELDKNSRQSNSEIAKKVGLNKNTVNYKINRMTQEGVIKGYYSVIDSSKLGYFSIRIYLKFFNTKLEDEKKMIEWLNSQKIVGVLAKIETIYDLVLMCWVKNIYEFEDFLQEFKKKFRKHFWQEKVHIFSKVLHFKRKYLLSQKKEYDEEPETIGGKEISDFDELDLKILRLLAKNARMPLIDISSKLKTPERTIAFRIKQLEKKKIIQGYRINLELQKIGFEYYKLNFILNDFSKYEELESFCKIHENVIYIDKTLEELDFEIDVEIKNKQELLKLISEIKEKFSVRSVDILELKEYIKLESIPQ